MSTFRLENMELMQSFILAEKLTPQNFVLCNYNQKLVQKFYVAQKIEIMTQMLSKTRPNRNFFS